MHVRQQLVSSTDQSTTDAAALALREGVKPPQPSARLICTASEIILPCIPLPDRLTIPGPAQLFNSRAVHAHLSGAWTAASHRRSLVVAQTRSLGPASAPAQAIRSAANDCSSGATAVSACQVYLQAQQSNSCQLMLV